METFLKQIRLIYSSVDFHTQDLWKFVKRFADEDGTGMIAIILTSTEVSENQYAFEVRGIGINNDDIIESDLYGHVIAKGTGAERFLDFIKAGPKFGSDITNEDRILASNLSLIGHFLGQEVALGETLIEHWGAGFELIYFKDGKFIKLEEYTAIIIDAPFGREVIFQAVPRIAMTVRYINGVMIITTFSDKTEQVFIVPWILDEEKIFTLDDKLPDNSPLLMSYIFTDADNKDKKYYTSTVHPRNVYEEGKSPILFERDKNGKLLLLKDPEQDVAVLRTLLQEIGYKNIQLKGVR
jgi:hypothetical protein